MIYKKETNAKLKKVPDPLSIRKAASKKYVDKRINYPSTNIRVDFKDKNIDNVHSIKINSIATIEGRLTPKNYVDQAIFYGVDEPSLLRLDPDEKLKLDEQDSIVLNSTLTSPKTLIELPTKSYVDSLHESRRNRRDLSTVFNDQGNKFENDKLTVLDSVVVNRDPSADNESAVKKFVDDSIGEGKVLRFNQTLKNYLKTFVGNDNSNLTEDEKIQFTDTTVSKHTNTGG